MSTDCLDIINTISRCQIEAMASAGHELDPAHEKSCDIFRNRVLAVQSALVFRYAVVAHLSIQEKSPGKAANLWKEMVSFCEDALGVLWKLKNLYSGCGTPELYNLALDYRKEAEERYKLNLEDSQCQTPIPKGLFPSKS